MSRIEKNIHQIYWDFNKTNKDMPNEWKLISKSWKKNHPTWSYSLWDDKMCYNLIKNDYPWFLETYKNYKHEIQRCDSVRPFILHKFGGIYADMDYKCLKPFDDIFKKKSIYFIESPYSGVTNALFASNKGNKILLDLGKEMIKNKNMKFFYTRHFYILNSTGPQIFNKIYKKNENNIIKLSYDKFNNCSFCEKKCKIKPNLYSYSIYSTSWGDLDTHIVNKLWCNKYSILILLLLFLFFIIYKSGYYKLIKY